jgi:microcystin-dependent protein
MLFNLHTIKLHSWLVSILLCTTSVVAAQVGFNNPNPDPTSILDLTAVDKGLLVPRLSKPQREAIASPGRSLLVFDTSDGKFYFYDGGQWFALNEWVRNANNTDVNSNGNVIINGNSTVTGITTTNSLSSTGNISGGSVTISGFPANALVPAGVIVMWSGSIASIPSGWALCNGSNSTPDLRDRFIVGAGSLYSVANTGGSNSVTLTPAQLPSHTHSITDPGHKHNILGQSGGDNNDNNNSQRFAGGDKSPTESAFFFTNTTANQTSTTSITINSTGSNQPHENRPPFYALAYIMKLP